MVIIQNKKAYVKLLVKTFVIASAALFSMSSNVHAAELNRIYGKDRYETSISISKEGWTSSPTAIIASGENFPDALCSVPLAKKYNSPIFLSSKNGLSDNCKKQITKLGVKEIFIIGGTGVISENVENQLTTMGIKCNRLAGQDRYETSLKIADKLENFNEVVISNGYGFADALSIAPIAAKKQIPIILSPKEALPDKVKNYLKEKSILKAYILGGTGVLSSNIEKDFSNTLRLSGQNRYDTNISIIKNFSDELNLDKVFIAAGENFPDALSGSALASITSSPIMLISKSPSEKTLEFTNERLIPTRSNLIILGGEGVVPSSLIENLVNKNYIGNTSANIVNFGSIAKEGNYIYTSILVDGKYKLHKMNLDGSNPIKITDDNASYINVVDGWIYYLDFIKGDIYKVKTDGTSKTKIFSKHGIFSMQVIGDWIYYNIDTGVSYFYKVKTDGTLDQKINIQDKSILGGGQRFTISGDYIYTDCLVKTDTPPYNRYIYKFKTDGSNVTKVSEDSSYKVNVVDNWVYYYDSENLYKVKTDGTNKTLLLHEDFTIEGFYSVNTVGNYIYYSVWGVDLGISPNFGLYRIKTDGTDKTKLSDIPARFINIVDGYVYFDDGHDEHKIYMEK